MPAQMHILYLVHDLNDPAVRRRVMMLRAGGAEISLAGFRRRANSYSGIDGVVPIDLGRTHDGRFLHRLASVGRAALALAGRLEKKRRPDVIIGRNLEMLSLAHRADALLGGGIPVAYECLDIHRLMLRDDVVGRTLRAAERRLARRSVLLVTSSPAFVERYFDRFGQVDLPVHLLENKVLELQPGEGGTAPTLAPDLGEPWRIGWFGALRCRRSLELLSAVARRLDGKVEIILRGRPAYDQLDHFDRTVAETPHLRFEGRYSNPEDLKAIYGEVHFAWLADFFEAGMNSNWLLPCRLYEGCRHATVPIAMAGTETARFLQTRGLGSIVDEASEEAVLEHICDCMDSQRYGQAAARVAGEPASTWRIDHAECGAFVERLRALPGTLRLAA